jgi:hypothetical protein
MSDEQTPEEKKKIDSISVEVDTRRTEALARENERLKMEKEAKPEFNLDTKKIEMFKKTNEPRYLDCKSKEEMADLTTALMREAVAKRNGTPSGNAPMNPDNPSEHMKFSSYEAMVQYCRDNENELVTATQTGKQVLDELFRKGIQLIKSGETIKGFSPNPEASSKDSNSPVEVTLTPNMQAMEQSEFRQAIEKANEQARERIRIARERMSVVAQKAQEKRENQK